MAAGLLLIVTCALLAREFVVGRAAPLLPDGDRPKREVPAPPPAAASVDDPIGDDARMVMAAARALPQRTRVEPAAPDPDRLDAPRAPDRRTPRPGSERFFLQSCRALAASDPEAFEKSAQECLARPAPLAEKVAWLLAARELGPERRARQEALVDRALSEGRKGDPRLRIAAVELLERAARRSGAGCLRLLNAIALAPAGTAADGSGADPAERARAASDAFAFADDEALAAGVELVANSNDVAVRTNVLRGLTRNPRPTAAAHRNRLVETLGWQAEAALIAATDVKTGDESDQ
jgi:hypothetical protein